MHSKMKRKNEEPQRKNAASKKRAISDENAISCFGEGVFPGKDDYSKKYAESEPLVLAFQLIVLSN
jgi:hypothetical protein